jgi:hypothetical protein
MNAPHRLRSPDPEAPPSNEPTRIPPAQAEADALERVAPKRPVTVAAGDILIVRERVPRVNQKATLLPSWRYRVQVFAEPTKDRRVFNSFQYAAFEAEHMATSLHARVIYVEENIPIVVADYRR